VISTILMIVAVVAASVVVWWSVSVVLDLWGPGSRRAQRLARIKAENAEAKRQVMRITQAAQMERVCPGFG